MAEVTLVCDSLLNAVNSLQERITGRAWAMMPRDVFVHNLENTVNDLEIIRQEITVLAEMYTKNPSPGMPDVQEHMAEFDQAMNVLKNNLELELSKPEIRDRNKIEALMEGIEMPELYASLENKALGTLLKTRGLIERVELHSMASSAQDWRPKPAQRNILHLLEKKEKELQELKEKYDGLKSQTYFGLLELESTSETEKELNDLGRKMEAKRALFANDLNEFSRALAGFEDKYISLENKLKEISGTAESYMDKAAELNTQLKKERDYAKRVLMEAEHETAKIRSEYSRSMMRLEESKMAARQEAKEKVAKDLKRLKKEAAEKTELIGNLRKMVADREKDLKKFKAKKK